MEGYLEKGVDKLKWGILFALNSFLAVLVAYYEAVKNKYSANAIITLYVLLVLFISLFNSTKVPENDLEWIVDLYNDVPRTSFDVYITFLTGGKEILYCAISYCLYYILYGNEQLFVFALSALSYGALFFALYRFNAMLKASRLVFVSSAITMAFFPYSFALSVHIVRQFMGLSFCFMGIINYLYYKNDKIKRLLFLLIAIASIFIHTSSAFFLPFAFIPFIKSTIKFTNIVWYVALLFTILAFSDLAILLLNYFGMSFIQYGLEKMAYGTHFETTIPLIQLVFVIISAVVCVLALYSNDYLRENKIACFLTHVYTLILFFVLLNYNNNVEMSLRYLFDMLILLPFAMSIILYRKNSVLLHYSLHLILLLFWIFYNSFLSQWTYLCSDSFFVYPVFMYFIN